MLAAISAKVLDPQFMLAAATAVCVTATLYTLALPFFSGDGLKRRMKAVSVERDRIRARERERLNEQGRRASLRQEPKAYMKDLVQRFSLRDWLGTDTAKLRLSMAGYRGPQAEVAFLFFRFVSPIVFALAAGLYVFTMQAGQPVMLKIGAVILGAYIGIKAPEIYLKNTITKRQKSLRRAFPDGLDLMLICVESGMAIEGAFRKVSQEIGAQSVALAEELLLTTAEMSYLPERRQAFENLASRTGLDSVKGVCTALIQAERYGTPIATALRVLGQEFRDQRMNTAEKMAAGLPPKLTVPMILFFLPVLFVVIMTPALIQVFKWS